MGYRKNFCHKTSALSIAMWLFYRNVMWLIMRGANIQRTHRASIGMHQPQIRFYRMGTKLVINMKLTHSTLPPSP